jgi:hypothetical protein
MSESPRLRLPAIAAGQIDKATTHNEALAIADIAIGAAIEGFLTNTPPASPVVGASYVVGGAPTGVWSGHALSLAGYTAGGWRFIAAFDGLRAIDKATGETAVFRAGAWEKGHVRAAKVSVGGNQVVGARLAAVADPAGGATVDAEARAAIADILSRLRSHGLIAS